MGQAPAQGPAQLSIVVPTFNERDNVAELVRRLDDTLSDVAWEVLFVDDDSPDGTAEVVREISRTDARVRCLQRIGRRGLSSACIEGMLASSAPYVAVMDADLQHDESLLRPMLAALARGDIDIAIGSRYVAGGSIGSWGSRRARISRLATQMSRWVVPAGLHDPMSGYFMMRREVLAACVRRLSGLGFKILMDIFASSPHPLRFVEIPYVFRDRRAGASKLDQQVAWGHAMLLMDKTFGRVVPVRFLAFAIIGGFGVGVHLLAMALMFATSNVPFAAAQGAATLIAMVFNFAANNAMTYRDRRLRGVAWWRGLLSFILACGVGAMANVGVASHLFDTGGRWIFAALAGILVGAVWNYAVTSTYTWGRPHNA